MDPRAVLQGHVTEPSMSTAEASESPQKTSEISKISEKLRNAVANHVDKNDIKDLFCDVMNPFKRDEMLAIQFSMVFNRLKEPEKIAALQAVVELMEQARNSDVTSCEIYERTIDNILYYLGEKSLINEGFLLATLVHTADYTLRSNITKHKWDYINVRWRSTGIKGIRQLFKALLTYAKRLPDVLSSSQRRQLQPMEDILVDILDVVPPIFTMTELYQFKGNIYLHAFPRVVERIAQIKAYCRPLSDLVFVVGRSFMFPILSHPQFQSMSSSWKVDKNLALHFSRLAYLPNKKELTHPQVYLFHMIMKQPKGKEVLSSMLKHVARQNAPHTFETIVTMLINETTAAVESLSPKQEIPRYQWDHLLSVVIFMAQHEFQAMTGVIKSLRILLCKHKYTRARDEIMWLMLQVMGSFAQNINKEVSDDMASLHKLLYPADMKSPTFTSGDDGAPNYAMVRHVSTACMYILQGEKSLKPPSQYLENQIEFIKQRAMENTTDLSIIAMLANAYRNETGRRVLNQLVVRLEGSPNEEQFYLPYGKPVNNVLQPLETALIDSLTMRSKMHLLQLMGQIFQKPREKMPSPAYFETYCRLFYSLEFDFGVKQFGQTIARVASSSNTAGPQDTFREYMYIVLDMLANRLVNFPTNVHFRQTTCLTLISVLHSSSTNVQGSYARELYSLSEQVIMREFCWIPYTEVIRFCYELIGKSRNETRSVNAHLCNPEIFLTTINDNKHFHVCPEIVRMLHISLLKAAKIMDKDFNEEPDFLNHIGTVFKWTPKQMRSFPTAFRSVPDIIDDSTDYTMPEEIFALIHSDYTQMRGLPGDRFVEYMAMVERKPTIFCVIYRAIVDNEDVANYPFYYQVLNMMSPRLVTVGTNWLVEYVIQEIGHKIGHDISHAQATQSAAQVLLNMVFQRHMIPFERILLSLALHLNNDAKAKLGMDIICIMLRSQYWLDRKEFIQKFFKPKSENIKEFFEANAAFHKKFPEFTYQELLSTPLNMVPQVNPKLHPPTYYGNLLDRLLPVTDHIISRFLEMDPADHELRDLLDVLAPIYKHHPNIFKYLYSLLHTQYGMIHPIQSRTIAKILLGNRRSGDNMKKTEEEKAASYLTDEFYKLNHQVDLDFLIETLIRRIIQCSEFTLEPPPFVEPDWRTAELSAPSQALLMACIELLSSPHDPSLILPAIINVLCKSEIVNSRPYATLNTVGLLLTALPIQFAKELHSIFSEVLEQQRLNDLTFEDIVYDNFEESVLLRVTNREMTINYALQAYWHHANQFNIGQFTQFFLEEIYPKITSENELWYFIRVMLPIQQWLFEAKIKHHYTDCIRQAKGLMEKIGELCMNGIQLEHGAELCDIFYHLKYNFLGDSLQNEASELLEKLPPNLRDRFKFYVLSNDPQTKISSIIPPDTMRLMKTRSNASERL